MRFDDTNPAKEDMEYVRSILDDVRWLVTGSTSPLEGQPTPWSGEIRHASDYFQIIYNCAEYLITNGLAYVENLTQGNMSPQIIWTVDSMNLVYIQRKWSYIEWLLLIQVENRRIEIVR